MREEGGATGAVGRAVGEEGGATGAVGAVGELCEKREGLLEL